MCQAVAAGWSCASRPSAEVCKPVGWPHGVTVGPPLRSGRRDFWTTVGHFGRLASLDNGGPSGLRVGRNGRLSSKNREGDDVSDLAGRRPRLRRQVLRTWLPRPLFGPTGQKGFDVGGSAHRVGRGFASSKRPALGRWKRIPSYQSALEEDLRPLLDHCRAVEAPALR